MVEPSRTAGTSLLSLLAGIPPETPPKKPENPLLKSLLLLSEVQTHSLDRGKTTNDLWAPPQPQLYDPFHGQGLGGSLAELGSLPHPPTDSLSNFRTQAPPQALTLSETIDAFGSAIRSIPETINNIGTALRTIGGSIVRGLDWLDRHLPKGPLDPRGRPVPRWNVQLYLLAHKAYQGDWAARATFLNEIEADDSPDNVLLIEDLLEPTFGGRRPDLRRHWEQEPPEEARRQLRGLLEGHKRRSPLEANECREGEYLYEHNRRVLSPSELTSIELREDERILYEQLRGALPERQYMFCWYRSQGMNYKEIAAAMGISISSVKTHAHRARANQGLRGLLGQ